MKALGQRYVQHSVWLARHDRQPTASCSVIN